MRLAIFNAVILSALAAGCAGKPEISEIATTYTDYQKITDKEVFVNPELAMLCRGITHGEVDAARIKYGPHANTSILIYMNKSAAHAFANKSAAYPEGSVIVKQKRMIPYSANQTEKWVMPNDTGVGGMVKREAGYDPKHGDWEYFYFENPTKIERGRIESCVQCHEGAKNSDYVFGTWRNPTMQE